MIVRHRARRASRSRQRPNSMDRHVHGGHVVRHAGRGKRRSTELDHWAAALIETSTSSRLEYQRFRP